MPGGRGLGWSDRMNISEEPQTFREMPDLPKVLTGSHQKVSNLGRDLDNVGHA